MRTQWLERHSARRRVSFGNGTHDPLLEPLRIPAGQNVTSICAEYGWNDVSGAELTNDFQGRTAPTVALV
jgi:hypothetical protein